MTVATSPARGMGQRSTALPATVVSRTATPTGAGAGAGRAARPVGQGHSRVLSVSTHGSRCRPWARSMAPVGPLVEDRSKLGAALLRKRTSPSLLTSVSVKKAVVLLVVCCQKERLPGRWVHAARYGEPDCPHALASSNPSGRPQGTMPLS